MLMIDAFLGLQSISTSVSLCSFLFSTSFIAFKYFFLSPKIRLKICPSDTKLPMQYIHSHVKIEKQNWLEEEKTKVNKLKCLQGVIGEILFF